LPPTKIESFFIHNGVFQRVLSKKIDEKVPQNFAYVALKEIKSDEDIEALKVSNIDRSIDLFNEIKRQKK
jgi:hypothetical protein